MKKIDAIGITLGFFVFGGILYFILQLVGIDNIQAGIWTQAILIVFILGWLTTYLLRVGTKNMTYHQQIKNYQDAFLQKRLDEMTPEELEKLKAEISQDQDSESYETMGK